MTTATAVMVLVCPAWVSRKLAVNGLSCVALVRTIRSHVVDVLVHPPEIQSAATGLLQLERAKPFIFVTVHALVYVPDKLCAEKCTVLWTEESPPPAHELAVHAAESNAQPSTSLPNACAAGLPSRKTAKANIGVKTNINNLRIRNS